MRGRELERRRAATMTRLADVRDLPLVTRGEVACPCSPRTPRRPYTSPRLQAAYSSSRSSLVTPSLMVGISLRSICSEYRGNSVSFSVLAQH